MRLNIGHSTVHTVQQITFCAICAFSCPMNFWSHATIVAIETCVIIVTFYAIETFVAIETVLLLELSSRWNFCCHWNYVAYLPT